MRVDVQELKLGENDYALFAFKNNFNTGCLVKGPSYVPRTDGVVVYLNGGDDLSTPLSRVEKAGGEILSKKTFLSEEAGHIAYFKDVRSSMRT